MLYAGTSVTARIETVVHTHIYKFSTCMKIHTGYEILLVADCVLESRHGVKFTGVC
jgi:hypothetical protein